MVVFQAQSGSLLFSFFTFSFHFDPINPNLQMKNNLVTFYYYSPPSFGKVRFSQASEFCPVGGRVQVASHASWDRLDGRVSPLDIRPRATPTDIWWSSLERPSLPPPQPLISGGHHWRPFQTCSCKTLTPNISGDNWWWPPKWAVRIVLECCLVSCFPRNLCHSQKKVNKHKWFNGSCKVHYHLKCQLSNSLHNVCQGFQCDIHDELSLNHTHYTARKSSFSPKKQAVFLMYWTRKVIFQQRTQWYNAHLPQPISSAKLPFLISVRNGTILSPGDI